MSGIAQYKVRGMDCAEEVSALKAALGRLPGVGGLEFDIIRGKMTASLDTDAVTDQDIRSAVRSAGMEALPWEETYALRRRTADEPFWRRRGRLVMVVASGVLLAAGFCTHAVLHRSVLHALAGGEGARGHVFPLASILLYAASVLGGAWFVAPKALFAARRLRPDMNLLMTMAIVGAMGIGQWLEAATVAFLFALALLLESWGVGRARHAVEALMDLSPVTARCISGPNGEFTVTPVEEVLLGATVLVRPGEKIPLDGVITHGSSFVNQAPITGESAPVAKEAGDDVFAGTVNGDGALEFRVTKPATDTTLARLIHMVEEAHSRRAPSEQWVERFARYYTPVMMVLAVLIALLPPLLVHASWGKWFYQALVILVIACPCALVISTPVSIVAGLASAARNGVLIKGGAFLEAPAGLKAVALDKTGTLTYGRPEVQEVVPFDKHTKEELLVLAASLEARSEHPLAQAVVQKAQEEGVASVPAGDFQALRGKGAQARIGDTVFWIGSHRFMEEKGEDSPQVHETAVALEETGQSVVAIGNDFHVCGLIGVADAIREQSAPVVRAMKAAGVEWVIMLTGDNEGTAKRVATATGADDYKAELLPEDKVAAVEELVKSVGQVAMVGDGVNDAPAMAAATVGIAMGAAGSDAAIETADIALMSDDLMKLPWLIQHSRRTLGIIKTNVAFALGVKFLFLVLAVAGIATLWMAIAADMGASLLVISNGLRLLKGQ